MQISGVEFVGGGVDRTGQALRGFEIAAASLGHIQIVTACAAGAIAGKQQALVIGRQHGREFVGIAVDRCTQVLDFAETGGGYFDMKKDADLNSSITRIAQELRSQYLLGFSPAALDGKVHRL